jgi:hypothetical protein
MLSFVVLAPHGAKLRGGGLRFSTLLVALIREGLPRPHPVADSRERVTNTGSSGK